MSLEPSPESEAPRAGWRIRDAVIALVVGVAVSAVVALALRPDDLTSFEIFAFVVPAQSVGTLATVWFLGRRRGSLRDLLSLHWRWADLVGVPVGAGIQLALSAIGLAVIETFFEGEVPGQEIVGVAEESTGLAVRLLIVLGLVVLGPISEEVVFRGMVLPALLPRGRRYAVVVTSLLFALLHLLDPNAIFAVPFVFVLSIVLCNEVLRTGRLARPIAIHAGFNLLTVVALFVGS